MLHVTLRDAETSDKNFVDTLTCASMQKYVNATWENEEERAHYYTLNPFQTENTKIIVFEGKDIGRVALKDTQDGRWILAIHLLESYQGKGIGKQLLNEVIQYAQEEQVDLYLTVLQVNPAKKLYEKLGFITYKEENHRFYMKKSVQ